MKRKAKEVKFRHKVVRVVFKTLLWPAIKIKYKYKYKKYRELKKQGPFLVLGNHTTAVDPILLGFSFPFNIYYIATEQIFNLGLLSKLLVYAVNPISKSKSQNDIAAIRKAKAIVKEGGSIGVYPEGNVTYDGSVSKINDSIVKLVRLLGIDIIIHNTEGLYLSDPRWSLFRKKGKTFGGIVKIIKKEEYDLLNNDELLLIISDALNVNAYDQQELNKRSYKGKNLAKGLERLVFMDLNTNEPFVTYTINNQLKSKNSDFTLTYDKYGYVTNEKGIKKTLVEINNEVKQSYLNYYKNTKEYLLIEELANIELTTKSSKTNQGRIELKLYKDKIVIKYLESTTELLFDEIISVAIQGKKKVIVNSLEHTHLITLDINSSPYKYLLTYQIYKEEQKNDITSIQQLGL